MNTRERAYLRRIYNLNIPLPQSEGGSQSSSVSGFISYSIDMRYAQGKIDSALRQLISEEDYPGAIDEALTELETWRAARERNGWDYASAGIKALR